MAGEGTPKSSTTTPVATRSTVLPPSNELIPAADAMVEDQATFVQPLAMVPSSRNNGGPVGANQGGVTPTAPFRGTISISSQDGQDEGLRLEPFVGISYAQKNINSVSTQNHRCSTSPWSIPGYRKYPQESTMVKSIEESNDKLY